MNDLEAKFNASVVESARILTPLTEAVTNELNAVAEVKYPASLVSCDILDPDTTSFFQVAMLLFIF